MISTAPRLAETKAMPVTQAGRERPEVRNSLEEEVRILAMKPTAMTKPK